MDRIKELADAYGIETNAEGGHTVMIEGEEVLLTPNNIKSIFPTMNRVSPDWIDRLEENEIFTFGSNLGGHHGAGAAKQALIFGAKYGIGFGQVGKTFAIPTKDEKINVLPLDEIKEYVDCFIGFTQTKFGRKFLYLVTPIGTGHAGYTNEEIAPLFKGAIDKENIYLPQQFIDVLQS